MKTLINNFIAKGTLLVRHSAAIFLTLSKIIYKKQDSYGKATTSWQNGIRHYSLINIHYSFFIIFCLVSCALLLTNSCSNTNEPAKEEHDYLKVPEGFPPIPYPESNPLTNEKIELGRSLFYDPILSRDSTFSCSNCHFYGGAFSSQGKRISHGIDNEPTARNALALVNVAYSHYYTWDGAAEGADAIEQIAYHVLTLKFEFDSDTNEINNRLKESTKYKDLFEKAFGKDLKPASYLATNAIAAFVRVLVSGNSRYDKYKRGIQNALNESELRGMELFFSERTKCSACHSGINFTDNDFHATGATNHYFDKGRINVTGRFYDWGKFKTPTLRNVEYSYPYMHEGIYPTLESVMEHYSRRGAFSFFNKDTLMRQINFTQQEIADMIAFLKSLSDKDFMNNPLFSKPD